MFGQCNEDTFGGRVMELSMFLNRQLIFLKSDGKRNVSHIEEFFETFRAAASLCMTNRLGFARMFLETCLENEEKIRLLDKDTISSLMSIVDLSKEDKR